MISNEVRREIQNIVRGAIQKRGKNTCSTTRNLLCGRFGTGPTVKNNFTSNSIIKEREDNFLREFAKSSGLWYPTLPAGSLYLAEGGESKVYFAEDGRHVIKVNDAGYYQRWTEYFNSLVLHNLFFPQTEYSLLGFSENLNGLVAILQQPYIRGGHANLADIEALLNYNDFFKTKEQDYYNQALGIALEDMHDENVVAKDETLFFIDTIFYILEVK